MTCEVCKHLLEIAQALKPCQICDRAHRNGGTGACGGCQHLPEVEAALKPCATCDSGKLHGQVSTDASAAAPLAYLHALPVEPHTERGVTNLEPEAEDALRIALATIFSFSPVEILLLQHTLMGGTYATFTGPLRRLRDQLGRYNLEPNAPAFRSLAKLWADKMVEKCPPLAGFFKASIEANRTRNAAHLAFCEAR